MTSDELWFQQHFNRRTRIRRPKTVLVKNKQRRVSYVQECEAEFRSLGEHNPLRRRIILWRVPPSNPAYDPEKPQILKIPFLAFADEEIADRDDVLEPIVHDLMVEEFKRQPP